MVRIVFNSNLKEDQKRLECFITYIEQQSSRFFVTYKDIFKGDVLIETITKKMENHKLRVVLFSYYFNWEKQFCGEIKMFIKELLQIFKLKIHNTVFKWVRKYYLKKNNWVVTFLNSVKCFSELSNFIVKLILKLNLNKNNIVFYEDTFQDNNNLRRILLDDFNNFFYLNILSPFLIF